MANASTPARTAPLPGAAAPDRDWPAQAADTIEQVVGTVREKTTGPAITAARGLVYGLFAGVVGVVVAVLFIVMAVRMLDTYLPDAWFGEEHMWAAYLVLGVVFLLVAAILWPRRKPREDSLA
jgi:hypothetical protein